MHQKEILEMDADTFYNWLAYETVSNDQDLRKRLLEELNFEGMSEEELISMRIENFFKGI